MTYKEKLNELHGLLGMVREVRCKVQLYSQIAENEPYRTCEMQGKLRNLSVDLAKYREQVNSIRDLPYD